MNTREYHQRTTTIAGLRLSLTAFGGLDTLPEYQEIEATIDSYVASHRRLEYKTVRGTIGGLEPGEGRPLGRLPQRKYAESENFLRTGATFDFGIPLPIKSLVAVASVAAGYS